MQATHRRTRDGAGPRGQTVAGSVVAPAPPGYIRVRPSTPENRVDALAGPVARGPGRMANPLSAGPNPAPAFVGTIVGRAVINGPAASFFLPPALTRPGGRLSDLMVAGERTAGPSERAGGGAAAHAVRPGLAARRVSFVLRGLLWAGMRTGFERREARLTLALGG